MDTRYQVFVSSTFEDLQEERQEVMHALLELDCMPSGMELFPAANDDQWTLIKKVWRSACKSDPLRRGNRTHLVCGVATRSCVVFRHCLLRVL